MKYLNRDCHIVQKNKNKIKGLCIMIVLIDGFKICKKIYILIQINIKVGYQNTFCMKTYKIRGKTIKKGRKIYKIKII